jgi:hypothetical protein
VYVDRVRMEQSLRELWTAVDVQACGGGAPTGLISMESALKALAGFLPNKSQPMQVCACVRVCVRLAATSMNVHLLVDCLVLPVLENSGVDVRVPSELAQSP